jgi:guanidinoacetate N-methyltransferase
VVPTLPSDSFDGILFDTYPLTEEEVDTIFHPFVPHAHRLLKPGGVLTYFSDEATDFSLDHQATLRAAGFARFRGQLCHISPPPDCEYWKLPTILAPVVEKQSSKQ